MARSNLDRIHEALEAGLTLEVWESGGKRVFRAGDITREKDARGRVRTNHPSRSLMSYVWLTPSGVSQLAKQAREKLARKDEILAEQQRQLTAFADR